MNFYPYNHKNVVATDGDLCVLRNDMGRFCGYCSFDPSEVPVEWHGNYNADALQYLAVHGGITYGEVHGDNDEERYRAINAAKDSVPSPDDDAPLLIRSDYYQKRHEAGDRAALSVPYTRVVFGFDCGHYRDEQNPSLSDHEHVLGLARQMRAQLLAFSKVVVQWRAADRDQRIRIMDEIRNSVGQPVELGFGALIGALAGAPEFDSTPSI